MNCYKHKRQESAARILAELAKPMDDDEFNPWALFPALYGGYSQDFDECALDVLRELRDGDKRRHDLGAEMFREMLCAAEMCDYGSSPRACFWTLETALLQRLVDRWAEWSEIQWGEQFNELEEVT